MDDYYDQQLKNFSVRKFDTFVNLIEKYIGWDWVQRVSVDEQLYAKGYIVNGVLLYSDENREYQGQRFVNCKAGETFITSHCAGAIRHNDFRYFVAALMIGLLHTVHGEGSNCVKARLMKEYDIRMDSRYKTGYPFFIHGELIPYLSNVNTIDEVLDYVYDVIDKSKKQWDKDWYLFYTK